MAHALQDRFSSLVDAKLRATLVQKDGIVWNNRYEGQPKAGVVKIPVRDTEVSVGDYDKANGGSATSGATSYLSLPINKDKYVNEIIDGYDAAAVPDNLVADRLDSAGYSVALQMNGDSTIALVEGGSLLADRTALSKTNVYEAFVDAATKLSVDKIPVIGRWALVSPAVYALILKSAEFIKASALGDAVVQSGAVGAIAGFTVYEDVTLPANVNFIVGHKDWCSRVAEWGVDVHLQDLSGSGKYIGASAVQGRKIYAHKVTKAAAVEIRTPFNVEVAVASHVATCTANPASGTTAEIYYTVDGTTPDKTKTKYTTAVTLTTGQTLKAVAYTSDGITSLIASGAF